MSYKIRIEEIDKSIRTLKVEIAHLEVERRKLVVDNCKHEIVDRSFINQHNGVWEEVYNCEYCYVSFSSEKAKEMGIKLKEIA